MLTVEQFRAATDALRLAVADDIEAALQVVIGAATKAPEALPQMMLGWIDTTLAIGGAPAGTGDRAVWLRWGSEHADHMLTADQVRPTAQWAGRLISARFADDRDTFQTLMRTAAGSDAWGRHVAELLSMCGTTIRRVQADGQPITRRVDIVLGREN